ncbi:MAG: 50S ribosomal protein L25 [Deltaproteobacteria bacterium]|nr:50S ribosomal protein L25 [Deltaproteobacteria bacterium]
MTEFNLEAGLRTETGKRAAKQMRREGNVPAVVYGLRDPLSVQVNDHDMTMLMAALHGSGRLIELNISGGTGEDKRKVLIKEVQTTHVGRNLLHIDFQEVDIKLVVQVPVEVRPTGKSVGEKLGGILQTVNHEIHIECLPTIIPEFIPVDVSHLDIGHTLHVSDVVLPEGMKIISPPEDTLFVMISPAKMAEEKEASEEGAEAGAAAAAEEKTED